MALTTTFSTLKANIADWLDRSDMSAAGGPIEVMISMAEDEIYRNLRLRFMEAATSPAIASGSIPIPSDFLELKQANITQSGSVQIALDVKPNEWIYSKYVDRSSSGLPRFIAQEGDTFIFGPYPDSGYTVNLQYYAKPSRLSTSNETNWLTTNAPDLLLLRSLMYSTVYLGQDERLISVGQAADKIMSGLEAAQVRERFPAESPLQMTVG